MLRTEHFHTALVPFDVIRWEGGGERENLILDIFLLLLSLCHWPNSLATKCMLLTPHTLHMCRIQLNSLFELISGFKMTLVVN